MHTPGVLREISIAVDTIAEARKGVDSEGAASAENHTSRIAGIHCSSLSDFGIYP
jgi:hypothetical protein